MMNCFCCGQEKEKKKVSEPPQLQRPTISSKIPISKVAFTADSYDARTFSNPNNFEQTTRA